MRKNKNFNLALSTALLSLSSVCCVLWAPLAASATASSMVQVILADVNAYRLQHGLRPLKLRTDLCVEAAQHSVDMARHRVPFGHDGFANRVKHMYAHTARPNGAAENVAYRYRDGHDVVKNWLTSSHHRANIVGSYDYTGIGLARDKAGHLYFTQLFLRVA